MTQPAACVTLIMVDDLLQERLILERHRALQAHFHTPVAPVLHRDEPLAPLRGAFNAHGVETRVHAFDEISWSLLNSDPGEEDCCDRLLIAFSADVDPALVRLACVVFGGRPQPLAGLAIERPAMAEGQPDGVLLLYCPGDADRLDVASRLGQLAGSGIPHGLLPVDDPDQARFTIIRIGLIRRVAGSGRFTMASSLYAPGRASGAPPAFVARDEPAPRELLAQRSDVLVINGHSSVFDGAMSAGLILCARADDRVAARPGETMVPCYRDQRCFRQKSAGRPADSREGLIGARELNSTVVLLTGCNVAAIGRSWLPHRRTLISRFLHSATLGTVASVGIVRSQPELDLLGIALIAEGLPLGQVVLELNRARAAEQGPATGLPPGAGPFVLFGNPQLCVEGMQLQRAIAQPAGERALSVSLAHVVADARQGALVKIELPTGFREARLTVRPDPSRWMLAVVHRTADTEALYLWCARPCANAPVGSVLIESHPVDPLDECLAAIGSFARELPFWIPLLDTQRATMECTASEVFENTLASIPGTLREVLEGCVSLGSASSSRSGVTAASAHSRHFAARLLLARAQELNAALLAAQVEVAWNLGSSHFLGWERHHRRISPEGPREVCVCGQARIWAQQYESLDGAARRRLVYHCHVCGPVGEDDGRRVLELVGMDARVSPGEALTFECSVRGDAEQSTMVDLVPLLECYYKERRVAGPSRRLLVHPGEVSRVRLELEIPGDLTHGTYPVAVLGVVNGSLWTRKRVVEIAPAGTEAPMGAARIGEGACR